MPGEAARLPLTMAQVGIWYAQQIDPANPVYNTGEYLEIAGEVDAAVLERALQAVVEEAETLRVRIAEDGDAFWQVLDPDPVLTLPVLDLSARADAEDAALAAMRADLALPVDPRQGPLFHFVLWTATGRCSTTATTTSWWTASRSRCWPAGSPRRTPRCSPADPARPGRGDR
jgi:hypothetical protein